MTRIRVAAAGLIAAGCVAAAGCSEEEFTSVEAPDSGPEASGGMAGTDASAGGSSGGGAGGSAGSSGSGGAGMLQCVLDQSHVDNCALAP